MLAVFSDTLQDFRKRQTGTDKKFHDIVLENPTNNPSIAYR